MISVCKICWQNWISNLVQGLCLLIHSEWKATANTIGSSFLPAFFRPLSQPAECNPPGVHPAPATRIVSHWFCFCYIFGISISLDIQFPNSLSSFLPPKPTGRFVWIPQVCPKSWEFQNPPGGIPLPQHITSRCYIIATFFIRRVISSLDHLAHGINGFVQEWLDDEKAIQIVYPSTGISWLIVLDHHLNKAEANVPTKIKDGICKLMMFTYLLIQGFILRCHVIFQEFSHQKQRTFFRVSHLSLVVVN